MLTTQYLEEAERLADDIVVIDHGRVIARGDARKLKREVGGDQVQVVVVEPGHLAEATPIIAAITGVEPNVDAAARSVTAATSRGVETLVAGGQGAHRGPDRRRRPEPAPAHPRRGVPDPHRLRPPTIRHAERGRIARGGHHDRHHRRPTETVAHDGPGPAGVLHDTWVIARRGLVHMKRQPEALTDATIQPIMFVLLFAYVFGGAIDVPGEGNYREFLMGGIFAQTIVFTAFGVAMALANDRKNQAVDRFRALPIARGAVLGGHAVANLFKSLLPIMIMSLCGLAIGWRIHDGLVNAVFGYLLLLGFAFAMIWVGVLLGSVVSTPEGVQGIAFAALFPVTFMASTFVPTDTMPGVRADHRRVEPGDDAVRLRARAVRQPDHRSRPGDPWSIAHPVAYTVIWIVGIIAVCAPLAVRAYQRSVTK